MKPCQPESHHHRVALQVTPMLPGHIHVTIQGQASLQSNGKQCGSEQAKVQIQKNCFSRSSPRASSQAPELK